MEPVIYLVNRQMMGGRYGSQNCMGLLLSPITCKVACLCATVHNFHNTIHDKCRSRMRILHAPISFDMLNRLLQMLLLCRYSSTPCICPAPASRPLISTPRSGHLQGSICSVCSVVELHHYAAEAGRQNTPLCFTLLYIFELSCLYVNWIMMSFENLLPPVCPKVGRLIPLERIVLRCSPWQIRRFPILLM